MAPGGRLSAEKHTDPIKPGVFGTPRATVYTEGAFMTKAISTVKDPVCGMDIDASQSVGEVKHKGVTYSFCGPDCRAKFEANPDKYLKAKPVPPGAAN